MQEQSKTNRNLIIAVTALGTTVAFMVGVFLLSVNHSQPIIIDTPAQINTPVNSTISANNGNYSNAQPTNLSKSPEPSKTAIAKSTPQSIPAPKPEPTKQVDLRIKGNKNSGIYHLPNCASYTRVAEHNIEWFKTIEEAENAGYRMAKNCR